MPPVICSTCKNTQAHVSPTQQLSGPDGCEHIAYIANDEGAASLAIYISLSTPAGTLLRDGQFSPSSFSAGVLA
jgi:hypothetical protein